MIVGACSPKLYCDAECLNVFIIKITGHNRIQSLLSILILQLTHYFSFPATPLYTVMCFEDLNVLSRPFPIYISLYRSVDMKTVTSVSDTVPLCANIYMRNS